MTGGRPPLSRDRTTVSDRRLGAHLTTQSTTHMTGIKRTALIVSVLGLIVIGHHVAVLSRPNTTTAWIYVGAFYTGWIVSSVLALLTPSDITRMFRSGSRWPWNLLPLVFVIPVTIFVFLPNLHLLHLDRWLLMNAVICAVNPFMEEIYWRGLASRISDVPVVSFLFSTLGFAASHPLIFGVNSPGVRGWVGFAGTCLVGSAFWICYRRTNTLRGCVAAHFLIDVSGMAVFILADRAVLASTPF